MPELLQEKKRSLSGWPMIIGWIGMIIFALHASTHMVGAGDTWVALACGRHFYNHGVDTNEPFSANSHRVGPTVQEIATWPNWAQSIADKVGIDTVKYWHPTSWVNQNWLTHVIFHWLAFESPFADGKTLSFNTLMYWKFAVYILTVVCIYYIGRIMGAHPALAAAAACASMFIGRSFIDIRPAGFSNLMIAVFLLVLVLSTYRNYLYIWLLVPATIFWANLHGGYIYTFIMLTPVVVLQILILLPRRATVSVHSILTWLALFVMMLKYIGKEPFASAVSSQEKLLILLGFFVVVSIILTLIKSVQAPLFYGYHIIVSIVVFIALFSQLFPAEMKILIKEIDAFVQTSRLSFVGIFFASVAMGLIVTFLKERFLATSPAAILHLSAAGTLAFLASIVFNPFHLTNLTHTFQISISSVAEGWRNVHEWWPAFRWDNPVGSAFPFLVMMVVGIGLLILWPISRMLVPKQNKLPKTQMNIQPGRTNIKAHILGFLAAALVIWSVMISCSLTDASVQSFIFNLIFVGILWLSVFVNVHLIYLILPFSLIALYASIPPTYTGRYIFPFVTIPFYCMLFLGAWQLSKKPKYSIFNILYVFAASIVTMLILVWLRDPFNFKEPVWHLEQFINITRQWSSPYEANLDIIYPYYFRVIYIINLLCIGLWFIAPYLKEFWSGTLKNNSPVQEGEYRRPKIDPAMVVVAAMTVYMAYRSRRFIPIAGYATCPVIAVLIDQIIQAIAASKYFHKSGRAALPRMSSGIQNILTGTAALIVIVLGTAWGLKFKNVYMDPWPTDSKLSSAFMRMTASAAKPFDACEFIRQNNMRGKMFNYWTEGGFIAWGQDPDPDGHTPLQLFMDGRAQAAYNYNAYILWSELMSGGPIPQKARMRNQNLVPEDYAQIGTWLDERLKYYKVWVVLMPSNQFETPFVKGLDYCASWRIVFLDDKQKLFVDITTPRGQELFNGIENGNTKYPDEYFRNIMISHNSMVDNDASRLQKGLNCALDAFSQNPTRTPIQLIQRFYEIYPQFRPEIDTYWKKYLDDYEANKQKYLNSDGYYFRAIGALMAMGHLEPFAAQQKNNELLAHFETERAELQRIIEQMQYKRW